ncbi:pyruvate-formate lyase [Candidatus Poribacteria bacterium]|nr:pyruvate-formate lyase [Candidatus Poribacteria bacterium]
MKVISLHNQELTYQQRIDALRQTKLEHTELKLKQRGYFDIDDHGSIPWPEPIPFKAKPNHPSGGCYGAKCIGENFRAWLEVHPVYIHPMSALAGAWVGSPPGLGGWKPEDRPTHLYPLHQKYNIISTGIGAMNHLGPDMKIGLDLGWGGILKKIRDYRERNRPTDTSFYDGEEAFVLGVQTWIKKHVIKAREMAAAPPLSPPYTGGKEGGWVGDNLLAIADMNEWLVEGAPRTLREACQFLAWFQSVDRMWGCGGALDQLDKLLLPYYEADKEAGIIVDDEEVVWYIASLLFNDTHYSQIGGPAPDGHDMTSRMSYLILEAVHRLKIPANIAVRVHDGLESELLRKSVQYLFEDGTGPCYSCSKGLDEGYAKNGVPIQLARMRAKVGCNWTALPGIEYCLQDVTRLCLVTPFLHAFNDMISDSTKQNTIESLWDGYVHHLGISVDTIKRGFDWHIAHQADNSPEIVLNLFCHGPIERGLDVSAGGVDIYNLTLDGVGLATVADSFAAIEQRVVKENRLTWEELAQHLTNDYAGAENVRLMLKNIPRFGTGGSRADWWAKRVSDLFTHLVKDTPTPNGFNVIPGLFSHGIVAQLGRNVGTTPNGRHAHAPISHSSNPDPGFMPGGGAAPTAKANAVAAVQPGWGNSAPLQIDFDRHLAKEYGGLRAIESLIKTHNAQGGTLININVISKEQILEAHADPDKYPDLVVRVTGYSAFFKTLSPEYRQQIVDRILAE